MSDSVGKDPHNRAAKHDDDEDDPVDKMLKKAGCLEKHYKVQECMVEHKDWRQCKAEVKERIYKHERSNGCFTEFVQQFNRN